MFARLPLALVALGLLVPALARAQQADGEVTGTVTYRERIMLPPTARVVVELQDVSRADAPATVIDTQSVDLAGKAPPNPFALTYDPSAINQSNTYAVRATIHDGERLLFTSTQRYPAITRGAPTSGIEIVVVRAGDSANPAPAE